MNFRNIGKVSSETKGGLQNNTHLEITYSQASGCTQPTLIENNREYDDTFCI